MNDKFKSNLFLYITIISFFILVITGPVIDIHNVTSLLVQVFSILLIVWAIMVQRFEKKNHHKIPHGAFFIQSGPYEILRHPIYAGLLLFSFSALQINFTVFRVILFVIFLGALTLKIIREEYIVQNSIPEYKEYKKKTKMLIPYLF